MISTICSTAITFATLSVLMTGPIAGQQAPARKKPAPVAVSSSPAATPVSAGLSVNDVLSMLEAKIAESIIVIRVKRNAKPFDLSTEQLVALKKAGASDALMTVLMDPSQPFSQPPAAVTPPDAVQAPAPAPAPATVPAPALAAQSTALELGVYIKKNGEWMEVRPEIVNWKTGGTIKNLASAGVVKKDLNGNIDGPSSKTSVKTPLEVLLVTAEGIAPEEYQLLRLRVNKDYREFRSVTGGILNQRSGAMRDLIPFEAKKVASRRFEIIVPPTIGAGEYGILPPGAGGTSTTSAVSSQFGKMHTFHIVE